MRHLRFKTGTALLLVLLLLLSRTDTLLAGEGSEAVLANALSGNALSENAVSENILSENALSENAVSGNAVSGIAVSENILSGNAVSGNEEAALSGNTPQERLTLIMVGDMLMHMPVVESGLQADGSYCFDHLFTHVKDVVESADIAIVNQETILGGKELKYSGYPTFNSPFEVGDAEIAAGFDVILQGTNHALDRGTKGIERCLEYWDITHPEAQVLGIHDSPEDQERLCIVSANGIRIAILNYTYGTNGIQTPKGKGYLVDYLSEERVKRDLARAEAEADFTLVCPHWGTEYRLTADAYQRHWAELFFENGADLVIGTHPHVIEPIEIMEEETGRRMPVYYSLGNYVNSTAGTGSGVKNRMIGGMAVVTIAKSGDEAAVEEAAVKPLVCHRRDRDITVYFLEDYTEELAEEHRINRQDPSFSLSFCQELADQVFLPDKVPR